MPAGKSSLYRPNEARIGIVSLAYERKRGNHPSDMRSANANEKDARQVTKFYEVECWRDLGGPLEVAC